MPPIQMLLDEFELAVRQGDDRRRAEVAYALAIRFWSSGQLEEARRHARICLEVAEQLPSDTLDDVAFGRQTVGGVPMPELFHDGVVRNRLAALL